MVKAVCSNCASLVKGNENAARSLLSNIYHHLRQTSHLYGPQGLFICPGENKTAELLMSAINVLLLYNLLYIF